MTSALDRRETDPIFGEMQDERDSSGAGRQTQRVIGFAGWSGSGKTTLVTRLIPLLVARGLSVSTLKHAHHAFDVDRPGKDSYRHREAGAHQVLVSSAKRWALMTENREAPEPSSAGLLEQLAPVDLVLIEGFKRDDHDKIEVHRPSIGKPPIWPQDPKVIAVASDQALPDCPLPLLPLNRIDAIVDFLVAQCGLREKESSAWPS